MANTQQTTKRVELEKSTISCSCQKRKEQDVLPGCQNCIDGSVCSEMYEALKEAFTGYHNEHRLVPDTMFKMMKAIKKAEGREE